MTQIDKQKLGEILSGVHDFYGKEMTRFAVQVWMEAFKGFDHEQVSKAFSAHLMDAERGQFMPKPADIVRQLQGTKTDRSLLAWGKVLEAMQKVGAYQSVVFDDPAIHAAVQDIGGWISMCRTETKELSYLEKRFCDSYKAYAGLGTFDYAPELAGQHALENSHRGFRVAPPLLIGNPEKAREVMRLGVNRPKTQITELTADIVDIKRIGKEQA